MDFAPRDLLVRPEYYQGTFIGGNFVFCDLENVEFGDNNSKKLTRLQRDAFAADYANFLDKKELDFYAEFFGRI